MDKQELKAWLRLTLSLGVGNETARKLLAAFGSAQAVFEQSAQSLRQLGSEKLARAVQNEPETLSSQLQTTMDQYNIAVRRIQALVGECEELRGNYEQSLRSKRAVELQYEESQTRVSELTTINISLQNIRVKIETELQSLAADYEEVTRELRLSDERYQKVQVSKLMSCGLSDDDTQCLFF